MAEELPAKLTLPTRDEEKAKWLRNYRLRRPNADIREGSEPDVRAAVCADAMMPVYAMAAVINKNTVLEDASGDAAKKWGKREGVDGPNPAYGASGYVRISASAGGTTIQEGDELLYESGSLIFVVAEPTRLFADQAACAVTGKSKGPATNLPAGAQLKWVSPRPGSGPTVTVIEQADGSGLSGGGLAETNEEFIDRILLEKRTKAASGNDAEVQDTVFKTPGLGIQRVFTYPGITGTGTMAVCFTMRPAVSGGSRAPNSVQLGLAERHLESLMPGDDGYLFSALVGSPASVVYGLQWASEASGWVDVSPWPPYYAPSPSSGSGAVIVSSASSATSFVLRTANNDYSTAVAPTVGRTLCFWDLANFKFQKKRILSVTGTGPWTIAVDTSNDASDTSFTPAVGQRAMPYSKFLDQLATGVRKYFDGLGPGEQVASFYDSGRRQRRSPAPLSTSYPSSLTNLGLGDAVRSPLLADFAALEGDGTVPPVGTPGVLSYYLQLNQLSFFPKT